MYTLMFGKYYITYHHLENYVQHYLTNQQRFNFHFRCLHQGQMLAPGSDACTRVNHLKRSLFKYKLLITLVTSTNCNDWL